MLVAAALHAAASAAASGTGAQSLLPSCTALARLLARSGTSTPGVLTQQHPQQQRNVVTTTTKQQQQQQQQPLPSALWLSQHHQRWHAMSTRAAAHKPRKQQSQPSRRAVQSDASQLTDSIMAAATPRELLEVVVRNHTSLNNIHIVAAMTRAAALWPSTAAPADPVPAADTPGAAHMQQQQQEQQQQQPGSTGAEVQAIDRQQLEKLMLLLAGPFVRALPDASARAISVALRAYASCGLQPPAGMLEACVQELASWDKLQQTQHKYVVGLVNAAARLGCMDHQLYSRAAATALSGPTPEYTPTQLASLVWAFAAADYRDRALGLTLTAKAVELLQRQLRQPARPARQGSKWRRQDLMWQFVPNSLTQTLWGSAMLGWLGLTPELMQLAAQLLLQESFVHRFHCRQACTVVWSYASTLNGQQQQWQQQQQQGAAGSSDTGGSTDAAGVPDADAASSSSTPRSRQPASSSSSSAVSLLQPHEVWPPMLRLAGEFLRRANEADAVSLGRMVWSLATLSKWVRWRLSAQQQEQQHDPASDHQQAVAEGSVVFDQVCSALRRHWQQQPRSFAPSAAITAWGLIAADKSGLCQLLALPAENVGAASSSSAPTLLLLQLLDSIQQLGKGSAGKQLQPNTVADLAVALAELRPRLQSAAALWQQSGSSGGEQEQGAQLLPRLSAAVDALAAAAAQYAATPGALKVADSSKMLLSFHQHQVDDAALYHDLLQHWTLQGLQDCNHKALLGALHAAAAFTAAQPDLVASAGALPAHAWHNLLTVSRQRWGGLDAWEKARGAVSVRSLCSSLQGVVPNELLQDLVAVSVRAV